MQGLFIFMLIIYLLLTLIGCLDRSCSTQMLNQLTKDRQNEIAMDRKTDPRVDNRTDSDLATETRHRTNCADDHEHRPDA